MLVLASASPRRHDLLVAAGIAHRVLPVRADETPPRGADPEAIAVLLAERKARAAAPAAAPDRVLAADTLVVLDGEILGKPDGAAEARRTLSMLSGREHRVITGVCLLDPRSGAVRRRAVVTRVRFRVLDPAEIEAYVESGEPFDKAGGYGIQGPAGAFVSGLRGSRDNVIGLPVAEVLEMLGEDGA